MRLRLVGQPAVAVILAACLAGCGSVGASNNSSDSSSLNTPHSDIYQDAEIRSKRLACSSPAVRDADSSRDAGSRFCAP